jgi:hypothetical protein
MGLWTETSNPWDLVEGGISMKCRWSAGTWGRAIRTLGVLAASFVWAACNGISGIDAPEPATASAAEPAVKQPSPVRLDSEKLAGLGLEEYPAISAEEVLEGGSGQRGEVFFVGDELAVGVWEADASILAVTEPFDYDEFVTVLSGKLILTDEQGTAVEYLPGESAVIPKGFTGTWQMLGNYREIYVMEKEAFMRAEGGE